MTPRFSFRTWMFVAIMLVVFCTLALVAFVLQESLREHTISQTHPFLGQEAALLKEITADRWNPEMSIEETDTLADELGRTVGMRVSLIRPDGKVIGDSEQTVEELGYLENHSARPEIIEALKNGKSWSLRRSSTVAVELMYSSVRLGPPDKPQLVIRLAMPMSSLTENVDSIKRLILYASLLGVLLSLVVAFVMAQQVYRPVRELTRTARQIADGDLSQRLRRYPRHEIGDLGRAFDRMADHLQDEITEVTRSRDRLETVLRGMVEGVLVISRDGMITQANQALHDMLSLEVNPLGHTLSETFRNPYLIEAFQRIYEGEQNVSLEIRTLGANPRVLDVELAALPAPGSRSSGVVAVFHDITERKRIEQMRRDFVAGVSHELRTPLAAIKGAVETLMDGAMDNPKYARRFMEVIERHTARLENLVVDLLSLARLESGDVGLVKEVIPLVKLTDSTLAAVADWAATRGVELNRELPDYPVYIPGDRRQLEQALTNLLDNAVKYSNAGDKVVLGAFLEKGMVYIKVTDKGQGIPSEHLPRVFERFYRVESDRSRQQGGTGLGLAIVKHTAQVHGGRVDVESFPGKGSTFTLILPART